MGRVRVAVLGPLFVTLDDEPVHLTPGTARLLLRLVAAEGEAVSADQLYLDLWGKPPVGPVGARHRNEVQKRVVELRQRLEPGVPAGAARLLVTERVLTAGYAQSAYRLVLGQDEADYLEFTDLVNRAAQARPTTAVALLNRAAALWRGRPFADLGGKKFAVGLVSRLDALHRTAREELARNLAELGQLREALPYAQELAAEFPDDGRAGQFLSGLRERLREQHAGDVLRREFPGLGVDVVVRRGDLFEQDDANLVIGFGDTFDTDTDDDQIIARDSAQGRLLERVYGGDRKRLDEQLAKGLRGVEPVRVETRQVKPKGKRRRFPIGTVVPLPLDGRRVFAVVHCRQDLDLVTHSSAKEVRLALEEVWRSVRQHGMLKPVAMPLMGGGLSRVSDLTKEQLIVMFIDTFVKGCRDTRCAPELRIVLRPYELEQVRILDVARIVEALDQNGQEPR
jgi:DNA-binding SARP family transcriptional activator